MPDSQSSKTVTLPDWNDCLDRVKAGTASALERFIADNEPAGHEDEKEFRDGLAAVLAEARSPVETKAPVIIGWAVGDVTGNPAMYNLRQFDDASDAARRWNKSITGLVQAPNTPTFAPRPYSPEETKALQCVYRSGCKNHRICEEMGCCQQLGAEKASGKPERCRSGHLYEGRLIQCCKDENHRGQHYNLTVDYVWGSENGSALPPKTDR